MKTPNLKRGTAVLAVVLGALVAAPSALAGTATYNSTGPLFVPNSVTTTSAISVPSGRTAVQSVEVTNFRVKWGASAQELSTQLIGPNGAFLNLFEVGCASFNEADVWAFSDTAAQSAFNNKFDPKCDLPGGTFRPVDLPELRKLSMFSGAQASGTWTLRATDNGVQFPNQGSIQTWALRIVHAPPTLTATAPNSAKLKKTLSLTATSNADGTVSTGGDANSAQTTLTANQPTQISYEVPRKLQKKIRKKGKRTVNVSLDFTDVTGGTASGSVSVKVKAKKNKRKKGSKS